MIVWPSIKALNKIDSVTIVARWSFTEYYPNCQRFAMGITIKLLVFKSLYQAYNWNKAFKTFWVIYSKLNIIGFVSFKEIGVCIKHVTLAAIEWWECKIMPMYVLTIFAYALNLVLFTRYFQRCFRAFHLLLSDIHIVLNLLFI